MPNIENIEIAFKISRCFKEKTKIIHVAIIINEVTNEKIKIFFLINGITIRIVETIETARNIYEILNEFINEHSIVRHELKLETALNIIEISEKKLILYPSFSNSPFVIINTISISKEHKINIAP